ncbi:MAG: 2-oxoacid:acceptor oxidoreductase family protein [Planctomycetes bacterium]|nr:2-oxoacid:acceptor oxidoreductase family protein [Planctomycetota bacterium]
MKIVITGTGGQGVVFLTRLITTASSLEGKHAVSTETHGMAQRGASIISFIKIGNYLSPLIRRTTASCAFCLKESESAHATAYLMPGSQLFLDSEKTSFKEDLTTYITKNKISMTSISATDKAKELGNPRGGNLFLLGFALTRYTGHALPSLDSLCAAANTLSPAKFRDLNVQLIKLGYETGSRLNGER